MKCIVIDDDYFSRDTLVNLVSKFDFLQLAGVYSNLKQALYILKKENIELVCLDVEIPEMKGVDMLEDYNVPFTILTSMKKDYASDAFGHNVIDYLVKPVTISRFRKAIEKVQKAYVKDLHYSRDYFFVKHESMLHKVPVKDVLWIEALGSYTTIHTLLKKYFLHLTLKALERKLPEEKFIRVHRSYMVNIDCIDMIEETTLFINKRPIPLGKSYKGNLLRVLNIL